MDAKTLANFNFRNREDFNKVAELINEDTKMITVDAELNMHGCIVSVYETKTTMFFKKNNTRLHSFIANSEYDLNRFLDELKKSEIKVKYVRRCLGNVKESIL